MIYYVAGLLPWILERQDVQATAVSFFSANSNQNHSLLCEVPINSIGKSFVIFSTRIFYIFYMQKLHYVNLL